ncbi:hypothetical protein ACLOJK_014153 [Asimina triloba]
MGVATIVCCASRCRRTLPTAAVRLLVDLGERLVGSTCCRIAMEGRSDGVAPLPILGLLSVVGSRRGRSRTPVDLCPIAASAHLCPPSEMRREDDAHAACPSRAIVCRNCHRPDATCSRRPSRWVFRAAMAAPCVGDGASYFGAPVVYGARCTCSV